MSEGLNEFERALARLQPTTAATGPMLYAMGRTSALRSARIWRGVSLVSVLVSVLATAGLGGVLLLRPEPQVRWVVVPAPAFRGEQPAIEPDEPVESSEPDDATVSTESPIPEWRLQHQHVGLRPEPLSEPGDAVAPRRLDKPEPLRAGDVLKGPLVWLSISTMGER
ncbi:MAG TPA: hypothetical protein VHR72_08980 [Gemmataceae bacterium]|jgi:hypothetical protein|nr:hypothetical protein [Gemmataceae bacterium]